MGGEGIRYELLPNFRHIQTVVPLTFSKPTPSRDQGTVIPLRNFCYRYCTQCTFSCMSFLSPLHSHAQHAEELKLKGWSYEKVCGLSNQESQFWEFENASIRGALYRGPDSDISPSRRTNATARPEIAAEDES